MRRSLGLMVGTAALSLADGCASHSDVEALKSEVASLRPQLAAMDGRVTEAQNDATIARRQSEDTNQKVSALYDKTVHDSPSP
jgi:outer membrane murein-binding lipoprotein Lpp